MPNSTSEVVCGFRSSLPKTPLEMLPPATAQVSYCCEKAGRTPAVPVLKRTLNSGKIPRIPPQKPSSLKR